MIELICGDAMQTLYEDGICEQRRDRALAVIIPGLFNGVATLHSLEIVHRDLKVGPTGTVKRYWWA